jgi:hypothetical protein
MSTICMKLDPDIHIGMHLVCFSKTRCDSGGVLCCVVCVCSCSGVCLCGGVRFGVLCIATPS